MEYISVLNTMKPYGSLKKRFYVTHYLGNTGKFKFV